MEQPFDNQAIADHANNMARREFFMQSGAMGLGPLALGAMFQEEAAAAAPKEIPIKNPKGVLKNFHLPPKVKSVIFLHMAGAPPTLDMLSNKPLLKKMDGKPVPKKLIAGERFAFLKGTPNLQGSVFPYKKQYGQAGLWFSSVVEKWMPEIADDICMIHSATTNQFNHSPAALKYFTGFERPGRPSMGSWLTYGLGSESKDLPGFVLMSTGRGGRCGMDCYGAGFLPSVYQGVEFRSQGNPVLYLKNPPGLNSKLRRQTLDALKQLNQQEHQHSGDKEILTRIAQYERANRMQSSVPELADFSNEPKHIQEMYGVKPGKRHFGNTCLLARRLVERGVRFVQLTHGEWDLHGGSRINIPKHCPQLCAQTMPGVIALIKDLKQRDMLKETLVIWSGEFGRTPMRQKDKPGNLPGRDHHKAFSFWMAGGGIKPGFQYGETDEFGYHVTKNKIDVHDIQATILHQMGINHEKLTYRYQGRDFRLTDVHGKVLHDILV